MRAVDLKGIRIGTADLADAVETFRRNFDFPVARRSEAQASLRIGSAEIEFTAGQEAGFQAIVLRVDDLAAAEAELRSRGHAVTRETVEGRPAIVVDPASANGARLVLTE
jgi:hypothetical protein